MRPKGEPNRDEKRPNRKFFERMPTPAQGLPKNADRSIYGHGGDNSAAGQQNPEWVQSEQVLVYHREEDQPGGEDWMSQLKQNSMQFLADQRGV